VPRRAIGLSFTASPNHWLATTPVARHFVPRGVLTAICRLGDVVLPGL
jgi:hypothetical protein